MARTTLNFKTFPPKDRVNGPASCPWDLSSNLCRRRWFLPAFQCPEFWFRVRESCSSHKDLRLPAFRGPEFSFRGRRFGPARHRPVLA
jgi:hypothetical protein